MKSSVSRSWTVTVAGWGAAVWLAAAGVDQVWAQTELEAVPTLESCALITSEADRLACYDAVLRGRGQDTSRGEERATGTQRDATEEAPAAVREPAAVEVPAPSPARQPAAEVPAPARAPAPARSAPSASAERQVVVVDVQLRRPLEAVFTLQDGEVWLQTDGRTLYHLGSTPFGARIQPGSLGSFFLAPDNGGRRVRVRLVE